MASVHVVGHVLILTGKGLIILPRGKCSFVVGRVLILTGKGLLILPYQRQEGALETGP